MKIPELARLAQELDEFFHLVIWEKKVGFEVVAIVVDGFQDAFPLPTGVQSAAAEMEMILDTTSAARLEIRELPTDFWEELGEIIYGKHLKVSILGKPGRKYLEVFHVVNSGQDFDRSSLNDLGLSESDLFKVTRWLRERSLFDYRSGDLIMEILTQAQ